VEANEGSGLFHMHAVRSLYICTYMWYVEPRMCAGVNDGCMKPDGVSTSEMLRQDGATQPQAVTRCPVSSHHGKWEWERICQRLGNQRPRGLELKESDLEIEPEIRPRKGKTRKLKIPLLPPYCLAFCPQIKSTPTK
jgi:hypothetical protein